MLNGTNSTETFGGNDWGTLPNEPCRFCGRVGGVQFCASENPIDRTGSQIVQCTLCKAVWNVDGQRLN